MFCTPLVSIIIPAYNAEKTLADTLHSICQSSLRELEVLLIDDGSTDGTAALADSLAAEDERIRVQHRPNGGRSAARNAGLESATGRYIAFADADDTITPDYLQNLVQTADAHGADIVVSGFTYLRCDGRRELHPACGQLTDAEITPASLSRLPKASWTHLYRSELVKQAEARFPIGLPFGEDTCFNYLVYPYCKKLILSPECGYLYLQAEETEERVFSQRHADSLADAAAQLCDTYARQRLLPARRGLLLHFAAHALARTLARCPMADIQHPTDTLRAALHRAGIGAADLGTLPRQHRSMVRRLLRGGTGMTPVRLLKHRWRMLRHKI